MAKRRVSKKQRQQQARKNQLIIGAMAALVVVIAVILIISNSSEAAPDVADERLNLDPVLGNPDAPVTLVEYGAYGCSACQAWHRAGIVEQILADYPDQVRFIFRDFPVIAPRYDNMAAELAQCALDQGQDQFWAFHNAVYDLSDASSSEGDLLRLADNAGLDVDALEACYDAGTHHRTVQYDEDRARRLGLRGTPAFLVNGQVIYNASPDVLRTTIEQALDS